MEIECAADENLNDIHEKLFEIVDAIQYPITFAWFSVIRNLGGNTQSIMKKKREKIRIFFSLFFPAH